MARMARRGGMTKVQAAGERMGGCKVGRVTKIQIPSGQPFGLRLACAGSYPIAAFLDRKAVPESPFLRLGIMPGRISTAGRLLVMDLGHADQDLGHRGCDPTSFRIKAFFALSTWTLVSQQLDRNLQLLCKIVA